MDERGWPSFGTPASENANFLSAKQLWFIHESEKVEQEIKDARVGIKNLEGLLREQGAFREDRFEEVARTANTVSTAEEEMNDAAQRRQREHAAFVNASAKRSGIVDELKAVVTETWKSDATGRPVSDAVEGPAEDPAARGHQRRDGSSRKWLVELKGTRKELRTRMQDTWNRQLRRREKVAAPWMEEEARGAVNRVDFARSAPPEIAARQGRLLQKGSASNSWQLELGGLGGKLKVKLRDTLHRKLRRQSKETSAAAMREQRAAAAFRSFERQITQEIGQQRSALLEFKKQISGSLKLAEEKAAELEASREHLRASTKHLEEVHLSTMETPCRDKLGKRPFLL